MRLLLFHPEWQRSCLDCQKWVYLDSGEIMRRPARVGLPVLRPKGTKPPCYKCPKIPEGEEPRPENAQEMSEKNQRAYAHYLQCRATGHFPDDPIVRRNAAIIRAVMDEAERLPMLRLLARLGSKV